LKENLLERTFGRLTVIASAEDRRGKTMWKCRCECGNVVVVRATCLKSGETKSCGCYQKECASDRAAKHKGFGTRLYTVWNSMRQRCNNPNNHAFHNYGGRGIKICEEWDDFGKFRDWAIKTGYDDSALQGECTLDRIDNDGPYSPSNCRWVSMREQSSNKRGTPHLCYNGEVHTLMEWADITGIKYQTIHKRYSKGWPAEAVLKPVG